MVVPRPQNPFRTPSLLASAPAHSSAWLTSACANRHEPLPEEGQVTATRIEQRRVDLFIAQLSTLTPRDWREVIRSRPSDDACTTAARVIDAAKEVSGRGPAAELREYTPFIDSRIERLMDTPLFRAMAAEVQADSTVLLAHVAKEAANALLVATMADFDIGKEHFSPRAAAALLYGPLDPFIPLLSLNAP
jgi:hypothetical protein